MDQEVDQDSGTGKMTPRPGRSKDGLSRSLPSKDRTGMCRYRNFVLRLRQNYRPGREGSLPTTVG